LFIPFILNDLYIEGLLGAYYKFTLFENVSEIYLFHAFDNLE